MNFDYPDLIKISTWDRQEVLITGTVSINGAVFNNNASVQAILLAYVEQANKADLQAKK